MRILEIKYKEDGSAEYKRYGLVLVLSEKATEQDAELLVSELVKKLVAQSSPEPVFFGQLMMLLDAEVRGRGIGTIHQLGSLVIQGVR